uniref:Uncharacterized protein n=2 Tax=Graphocephala atropunctata TaxID=36148 RepID=A0A1B6LDJ2_9HEMI
MMRMALWMQTLALGVVLPSAVVLALFAAWKGITISLMALMLAGIVGLKGLVASASKSYSVPHHVTLSGLPSHHQHYWKRLDVGGDNSDWDSTHSHQFAYRAHA